MDSDGTGLIDQLAFQNMLRRNGAIDTLTSIDVDVVVLADILDYIFKNGNLAFEEFIETVLRLRGSNKATVRDIFELRKLLQTECLAFNSRLQEMSDMHEKLLQDAANAERRFGSPSAERRVVHTGQSLQENLFERRSVSSHVW